MAAWRRARSPGRCKHACRCDKQPLLIIIQPHGEAEQAAAQCMRPPQVACLIRRRREDEHEHTSAHFERPALCLPCPCPRQHISSACCVLPALNWLFGCMLSRHEGGGGAFDSRPSVMAGSGGGWRQPQSPGSLQLCLNLIQRHPPRTPTSLGAAHMIHSLRGAATAALARPAARQHRLVVSGSLQ